MRKKYLSILGLTNDPTLEEIKRAYKKKAKVLHPDVNSSKDAERDFIQLTEAFNYLYHGENLNLNEDVIQDGAMEHYSEYKNTEFRDEIVAAYEVIFRHLLFLITLSFFIIPVIGYLYLGGIGLFISAFLLVGTANLWASELKSIKKLNIKEFIFSIFIILKTKGFWLFMMGVGNIYILGSIGFSTFVNTKVLVLSYIILLFTGLVINRLKRIKNNFHLKYTVVGILPSIASIILVINFVISTNPIVEKYPIMHEVRWYSSRWDRGSYKKISLINLPNNRYAENFGIRVFLDFESMRYAQTITYQIEEGIIGFRVMKDYQFK